MPKQITAASGAVSFFVLALALLLLASPARAQQQPPADESPGSISGTIVDPDGAAVVGAQLKLSRSGQPANQDLHSGDDGQFTFFSVPPGPFEITVNAAGFSTHVFSGTLHPGEVLVTPRIALALAAENTVVKVTPQTTEEIAIAEIKI